MGSPRIKEPRPAPYRDGVIATISRSFWYTTLDGVTSLWQGHVGFEGPEHALRQAGLLLPDDRLPTKPRGDSGRATMRVDGTFRLRLAPEEVLARDTAFRRFIAETLRGYDNRCTFDVPARD
jgi:hypothetical protein